MCWEKEKEKSCGVATSTEIFKKSLTCKVNKITFRTND
jgi:hypothetical protein